MNEPGDLFRQLPHSVGTVEKKLSKSSCLQWVIVPLKDLLIGLNPLLDKDRKERCRQTAYKTDDPQSIHPNVRKQWAECRVGRWRSGNLLGGKWDRRLWWDGNLWDYGWDRNMESDGCNVL